MEVQTLYTNYLYVSFIDVFKKGDREFAHRPGKYIL